MAIQSILKPDGSVAVGIATAIVVYTVYDRALPNASVIHATDANDPNIEASRKKATWTSAGVLSTITLITKDVNVLILGGVVLFALDFHTRHANASNPVTQELVSDQGYASPSVGGGLRSVA
jgi:hypothetical protein